MLINLIESMNKGGLIILTSLTLKGGNPPIHQWCGQIPRNIQSPWSLTLQGGDPPMNPIPQWSGEVLESNHSFRNQPIIHAFDPSRQPQIPHAKWYHEFHQPTRIDYPANGKNICSDFGTYSWPRYATTC